MEAENKKLDQFTKNVIQEAELAIPSTDFLANVMDKVSQEKVPVKVYKPLITKVGWLIIGALFLLFAFVLTRFSLGFSIFGDWDLSSLMIEKYKPTIGIPEIPVTYAYCFFFLLVFVVIQIRLIKKQFDKRFTNFG
ncbi:hypothetical protein KORDIASMS9_03629 [Kordia sp. SMS9]|uniref:hypothetical protein n=1 Tax=Kordia sp. SMS9 TaxID=2282170 RepID=UPI000E0CCD7A|nr:hypothetical protein [Kordia sp. SMS9]AXG71372.1 hypothetical protein KORDIASMS9_03629 [Kordia sp. SMS9]